MKHAHAYVGRKPCGCIVAAVIDEPEHPKDTARSVSEMIRNGYVVERVEMDVVRQSFSVSPCPHEQKQGELFTETTDTSATTS